jgi:hypothetical protein
MNGYFLRVCAPFAVVPTCRRPASPRSQFVRKFLVFCKDIPYIVAHREAMQVEDANSETAGQTVP